MAPSFSFGYSELLLASRLLEAGRNEPWTFEVVATARGDGRPFLISAGLEQALDLLQGFALTEGDLAGLRSGGASGAEFGLDEPALARLAALRFRGDVAAVPEGMVVFGGEPLLRLRAAAPEAVVVGTAVVAALRAQTTIATAATRMRLASAGKPILELGPGALGREGGLVAARAAFVGGTAATANALAAGSWSIPSLLVVTPAQLEAMDGAAGDLPACDVRLDGVAAEQIDAALAGLATAPRHLLIEIATASDPFEAASSIRERLRERGWNDVGLIAVGELDEALVETLARPGTPFDGFGVDPAQFAAPQPTGVTFELELVERDVAGRRVAFPRRDGGAGSRSLWRKRGSGRFVGDTVQADTRPPPSGSAPLLVPVMDRGKRLYRSPNLSEARVLCESQLSMLDPAVTRRVDPEEYSVTLLVEAPPAPAKPQPVEPVAARPKVLDELDDSADFTFVSNVFASVVAPKLAADAAQPSSDDEDAAEEAAADEPTEAVESSRNSEDEAPEFEELVEPPSAPEGDMMFDEPPPPSAIALQLVPKLPSAADAKPAAVADPPQPVATLAPASESGSNGLLAAAARLRAMQGAGALAMKPAAPKADAPPPPDPAPVPKSQGAGGNDPLLAAAARLRSLRGS